MKQAFIIKTVAVQVPQGVDQKVMLEWLRENFATILVRPVTADYVSLEAIGDDGVNQALDALQKSSGFLYSRSDAAKVEEAFFECLNDDTRCKQMTIIELNRHSKNLNARQVGWLMANRPVKAEDAKAMYAEFGVDEGLDWNDYTALALNANDTARVARDHGEAWSPKATLRSFAIQAVEQKKHLAREIAAESSLPDWLR